MRPARRVYGLSTDFSRRVPASTIHTDGGRFGYRVASHQGGPAMAETEQTLEELAKDKLSMGFMVRREMKKLPELLAVDEDAVNLARGEYDGKEGLIVVTDRRIMFVEQGMIRHNFEDFPYEKVNNVKTESGMRSG
jgi:hypothetical protein